MKVLVEFDKFDSEMQDLENSYFDWDPESAPWHLADQAVTNWRANNYLEAKRLKQELDKARDVKRRLDR